MGNCILRCRLCKSIEKRKLLDRRNGFEGVVLGEFLLNGDLCKVNMKMLGWFKEVCLFFDLMKFWFRDEDLNGEVIRN